MTEIVYYYRNEAHFESFPTENYVDYMTNVMLIPEMHFFLVQSRSLRIICEVSISGEDRALLWRVERVHEFPNKAQLIELEEGRIASTLDCLVEGEESKRCHMCEKNLRQFIRFF